MSRNVNLRSAVRVALGMSAGVVASMALTPAVMAQAPQGDQQAVIEEITVTGSRIRRADLESASPVTVINRDEIVLTGLTDVGKFIQRMPSMSGSPIGTTTNNGGNGAVLIDLRGLGVDRTLTLINGHRLVDGGDFQTIPQTMIERVEILKDGASAVYGADAVAGVVNIITRKDFEGVQFDAQTADYFDMDSGRQTTLGIIAGKNFTGGNFVFGGEYVKQDEAYQSDAPWDFFQNAYYIYPGGCERQLTAPYDGTPEGGCYPAGSSSVPGARAVFPTHGTLSNRDGTGLTPGFDWYNYAPVNYIQTPYERVNLFADGYFDLTPSVRFTTSVRANYRESAQELAPLPYFSEFDPGYGPNNTVSVDNYYLVQALTAAGLAVEAPTSLRRRFEETTRRFTQDITQFQTVFGFEGDWRDMNWEINYNKGYRSRMDVDFGQFFGPNLRNAMGPSADLDNDGVPECYTDINDPGTLIAGCVPINFFGGPMSVTQDMIDYVSADLSDQFITKQDIVNASITGNAFDLPGGKLGWAVGAGYWGQFFKYTPDSAKALDEVTGNTGAGTQGSLYSNSIFGEVLAPVFNNGTQALDLKAGVRRDDYNIFGSEVTWQFGAEFRVTQDLKLRATAGTVFRAPTIGDLFSGQADSFPTATDPCAVDDIADLPPLCPGVAPPDELQLRSRVGGNMDLEPETGDTFTAGLVWTPEIGPGNLSVTVDYWQAEIDDGISSFGVSFILEDCYTNENPASCALITRRPDNGIDAIIDITENVTQQGAKGVDTEVRYSWDTSYGQFTASVLWAHLIERTKTALPGAPEVDLAGTYTDVTAEDGGAYPENKIAYSLQWLRGDLSIAYLGEYISSLDTTAAWIDYDYKVDSQLYHDLVASYEYTPTNTRITASITNFTDEPPPFIDIGFNAKTEPSTYRMFGRGYWVRLEQKF
jgi:iron complex outermembrane recepter protein